jgi:predicted PhzF superfamily epimerase YddE/YHI9
LALRFYVVDAFTDRPFRGNPAGVCLLPAPADERWMQAVAREMNLPETAFLRPQGDDYGLRWFSPATEVELCGHATLASAHVLWEEGLYPPSKAIGFNTRSGALGVRRRGDLLELDLPALPAVPVQPPPGLLDALGVDVKAVARNRFDYLVELGSEQEVRELRPDLRALAEVPARGIMVTGPSESPAFDFVSRFFAPRVGIDEDPVTGSAFCALGPFWGPRLKKEEMRAYQASRRGGETTVRLEGDRVIIGGRAITVLKGEIEEP